MTRWFEDHTVARYGRYREVEPTVVVEIAFDVIVRVSVTAGLQPALPAHRRLRPDKSPAEIDTVATVTALYEGLQQGT